MAAIIGLSPDEKKVWLTSIAAAARKRLVESGKITVGSEAAKATDTGGWRVRLGHSRAEHTTRVEVWLDQWFGLTRAPIFWFGFYWTTRAAFHKACDLWESASGMNAELARRTFLGGDTSAP